MKASKDLQTAVWHRCAEFADWQAAWPSVELTGLKVILIKNRQVRFLAFKSGDRRHLVSHTVCLKFILSGDVRNSYHKTWQCATSHSKRVKRFMKSAHWRLKAFDSNFEWHFQA